WPSSFRYFESLNHGHDEIVGFPIFHNGEIDVAIFEVLKKGIARRYGDVLVTSFFYIFQQEPQAEVERIDGYLDYFKISARGDFTVIGHFLSCTRSPGQPGEIACDWRATARVPC